MIVTEHGFEVPVVDRHRDLRGHFAEIVAAKLPAGFLPLRFVVTRMTGGAYECEVSGISGVEGRCHFQPESIFRFVPRCGENTDKFTAVLLVPTGIGAEIGGHAGDAGPVARLLGQISDRLILHPNVVNASDVNELPENALYVEGSVICRWLMGTVGLQCVRQNRVLTVIDAHKDELFVNAAVNAVSGARAAYGLLCPEVVCLDPR